MINLAITFILDSNTISGVEFLMDLELNIVGGATWILNVDNIFKIGCDPVLAPRGTEYNFKFFKSKRVKGPVYDDSTFENVQIWLITHEHTDHLDEHGIKKICNKNHIICNRNSQKLLKSGQINDFTTLNWHESHIIKIHDYVVNIQAIPAYHGNNYLTRKLAGQVNGYIIKINDGRVEKSIYATSDTVFDENIIKYFEKQNTDVLIANMGEVRSNKWGGPLTMNISMLEMFKKYIKPKHVIPVHIDDFSHYETNVETLQTNKIKVHDAGSIVKL